VKVIPGPASTELGTKIAELIEVEVVPVTFKFFPDGESYVRLNSAVKGDDVLVVQTTSPPQDTHLLQLLQLCDTAKDLGAKEITAVVPYLAYARQDKRFLDGEAVSINTVRKFIEAVGVDRLLTVNIHKEEVLHRFSIPAENLSAMPLLAEYFFDKGLAGALSLAPDEGAVNLVKETAAILKGGYSWLRKERDRTTGEINIEAGELDVKGRDVIVFDDIISSGGTIVTSVAILKRFGARRVYTACTHPLLIGEAEKKILSSGAEDIIGTDSVPGKRGIVSVAPLIAKAMR
jgi:ribose-phosphate pyrophosphokinase